MGLGIPLVHAKEILNYIRCALGSLFGGLNCVVYPIHDMQGSYLIVQKILDNRNDDFSVIPENFLEGRV